MRMPFCLSLVQAGFPSPADNYVERVCDLNDFCIANAKATFFVRAVGDSMEDDHIHEGHVLVVDCSRDATGGEIVMAWANGGNTIKRIHYTGGSSHGEMILLMPSNPRYELIYIHPGDDFKLFGVVPFV